MVTRRVASLMNGAYNFIIFISSRGFSPVGGLYPIYMPVPPCLRGHFRRLSFYQFFVRASVEIFCPWTRTMSSPSRVSKQWNRRSCLWVSSLWDLVGVCEKDATSWKCLRIYPVVAKLRSWRQEVEENFSAVHLIRVLVHSSYWEFDSPIVSHRVLEIYSEFVQCSRS